MEAGDTGQQQGSGFRSHCRSSRVQSEKKRVSVELRRLWRPLRPLRILRQLLCLLNCCSLAEPTD